MPPSSQTQYYQGAVLKPMQHKTFGQLPYLSSALPLPTHASPPSAPSATSWPARAFRPNTTLEVAGQDTTQTSGAGRHQRHQRRTAAPGVFGQSDTCARAGRRAGSFGSSCGRRWTPGGNGVALDFSLDDWCYWSPAVEIIAGSDDVSEADDSGRTVVECPGPGG